MRLFSKKSGSDKGTLYQLKNLIHRTSVPADPEDDMNAAEDFMQVVLEGYIVAAANELKDSHTLTEMADEIVQRYVQILPENRPQSSDEVHTYSCELISLGLLWYNYYDAIREGDGKRVMAMWKFLLVIFKKSGRRNYAKEAAMLLIQYHFLFSERKAAEVRNSRFVNTHGRKGYNIPCDLHIEHLNRRLKGVIRHMGSNIQPPSLVRAAKSIGVVNNVCSVFEREIGGKLDSARHSYPSSKNDFQRILNDLTENKVCVKLPDKRTHGSISIKHCLLDSVDREGIESWLMENVVASVLF